MEASEILSLNSKRVLKVLTKEYGYTSKEISSIREMPLEVRFGILKPYFSDLQNTEIGKTESLASLSHASEKV